MDKKEIGILKEIKLGVLPSVALRRVCDLLGEDISKMDLACLFGEAFDLVSGEADHAIWYWGRKIENPIDDTELDRILLNALREAGHLSNE